jgi:hypothetical protein
MSSASVGELVSQPYKYGFVTDIETEKIAKGRRWRSPTGRRWATR